MHVMRRLPIGCCCAAVSLALCCDVLAADWPRFRGANGAGVCSDDRLPPTEWNGDKNRKWKTALPGPGSSSPIVVGDRVYVTCWSGYGVEQDQPGDQQNLQRHLVAVDRSTGSIVWDKTVDAELPEDEYGGMFAEHGYASHTPVSDGTRIYVYFGKSGALAFDLDGNRLWRTKIGVESDPRDWGSASSPVLYGKLLIVTASAESEALAALDVETGNMVWRKEAQGFGGTWGTPTFVTADDGRTDLVLGVPNEIWGFDPQTGKLRWHCSALDSDSFCSSVVTDGKVVYAVEGRGGGSIAVRPGGEGDVTQTHVVWSGRHANRIGTPLVYEGRLYFVSNGIANCIDCATGETVYRERLRAELGETPADDTTAPVAETAPTRGFGERRRGGGGRGRGGQDYSSLTAAQGVLYYVSRNGIVYVWKAGPQFEQAAANRMTIDAEDFSATPAISAGQLFIRSSRHLYCIAETDEGS